MNFNKEQLNIVKEFIDYLNYNTTKKEKKSILVLSSVDFVFFINLICILLEENNSFEEIIKNFGAFGVTTGILLGLINIYVDNYKEEKEINKKRIRK